MATGLPDDCGPTFDFLRTLLLSLPLYIHKRIRAFYLVHPTLKMRFTFTFLGAALWGKLHFVDALRQLHEHFVPGSLLVPETVALEDERRRRRLQRLAGTATRQPAPRRTANPPPAVGREQAPRACASASPADGTASLANISPADGTASLANASPADGKAIITSGDDPDVGNRYSTTGEFRSGMALPGF